MQANPSGTAFLRCLAILIVINSHSDAFYPNSQLATGGAIGNALFFMLSSLGLYLSERSRPRAFVDWYSRRVVRIYPAVWVVFLAIQLPIWGFYGRLEFDESLQLIGNLFYPVWWFLQALLVYYLLVYPVIHGYRDRKLVVAAALGVCVYMLAYATQVDTSRFSVEDLPFRAYFYFLPFLLGIFIARRLPSIRVVSWRDTTLLILFVGAFYLHKYFMDDGRLLDIQFLQQWVLLPISYYAFKVCQTGIVTRWIMGIRPIALVATAISAMTLELYMVHLAYREVFLDLSVSFPVDWVLFLAASFASAYVVHRVAALIQARARARVAAPSAG